MAREVIDVEQVDALERHRPRDVLQMKAGYKSSGRAARNAFRIISALATNIQLPLSVLIPLWFLTLPPWGADVDLIVVKSASYRSSPKLLLNCIVSLTR